MADSVITFEQIHQYFIKGLYRRDINGQKVDAALFIKSKPNLDAEQSLAIYRGSVFGNLTSALGDIYPAIKRCVGGTFFDAMSLKYIDQYPSTSASLDEYGEHLAYFISNFKALAELPYLVDLAELEWHWHLAFNAPDEAVFDANLLNAVPETQYDEIVFRLSQSVHLIDSPYPLSTLWEMNRGLIALQEIDLSEGGSCVLVWRAENYEMRVDKITQMEYALLTKIKNKQSLGTVFQELLSEHCDKQINHTLSSAVERGWIAGFSLTGGDT